MKKIRILTLILTIVICASALALTACGDKKISYEESDGEYYEKSDGEYWSIDLSYEMKKFLKKTVVEDGKVVSIHYYDWSDVVGLAYFCGFEDKREVFNYEGDKLISSETFEMLSDFEKICDNSAMMKKIHQTVYVYDGDKIVRGEVYVNGLPTQSYDEYEYTSDGRLNVAKRYENGKLNRTYTYGQNGLPTTFEIGDYVYELTYNAKGSLTKIREKNENKNAYSYDIQYKNGRPSTIDYSQFIAPLMEGSPYMNETTLKLEYTKNGEITHIDAKYNISNGSKNNWYYTDIEYDENGRAISIAVESSYSDKSVNILTYNDLGILVSGEHFKESDGKLISKGKYESKGYTDDGRCLGFVDYFGHNYSYKYDENGRLIEKSYDSNVIGYEHEVETYEYYPNGVLKLLTNTCDGEVRHQMEYYESSNLKAETQYYGNARVETYDDSPYYYVYSRVRPNFQISYKHNVKYLNSGNGNTKIQGTIDIPQN